MSSGPYRVRTLLRYLNYSNLRTSKILPSNAFFTGIPIGGKFPALARKIGYSEFGFLMEFIIHASLVNRDVSVEEAVVCAELSVPICFRKYFKPSDYTSVGDLVRSHFSSMPTEQAELTHDSVQGHPDIIYKDCVYDIKTTGRFSAMRSDTILQLLSYYCLSQMSYPDGKIKKIGLILPAQNRIIVADLQEWNWKRFWKELMGCIQLKHQREALYAADYDSRLIYEMTMYGYIGTHVSKDQLLHYIRSCGRPSQFFVAGRSNSSVSVAPSFRKHLKEAISQTSNRGNEVFIHSPYTLNLSKPTGDGRRSESGMPWVCKTLISLLEMGAECGLSGIVVHCGQRRTKNKKVKDKDTGMVTTVPPVSHMTALFNMFECVHIIAEHATNNCPLLIETPAGQAGEMLAKRDELISFFMAMSPATKGRVKMCIDTCHVFAAGYKPDEYIQEVIASGIEIGLIHYNDSNYPLGCGKDSHATPGNGYIGFDSLFNVLNLAIENKIPCVFE